MRILLVVGTSSGGVGRHVHDLVIGLTGRGDAVVVAGPTSTLTHFDYAGAGARTVALTVSDRPDPRRDAGAVRTVAGLARDVDVVHAHGVRVGALAALALGRGATPLVVTLHNAAPPSRVGSAIHRALELLVARRADLVLGVSSDLVAGIRRAGARRADLAVVPAATPPPIGADRFTVRTSLGVDPGVALLVTVARLAPQKDLGLLLDAVARLVERPGPVRVLAVVAGEGPERAGLQRRITDERLPVRLLGHRTDVADLMAAADVVVSTARWEGQPVALQEALHLGCAIVATDAGGTSDVVGDGAILVPTGDAASMASALADVLSHGGVRDDLRSKAIHRAGELPTRQDAITAARAAYDSVLR